MPKSSKSCGYTGHMRTMNRINNNKEAYQSEQAKSRDMNNSQREQHLQRAAYPEVAAEARAAIRGKCNCSKKS